MPIDDEQLELDFPPGMVVSSVDDDEDVVATEDPPKLDEIKLDDGKSVADVMKEVEALRTGLKMSESARLALEESIKNRPAGAPAPAPQPPITPPWGRIYSDADFERIAEEHGQVAAAKAMITQNNWLADQHFERRLAGLQVGGVSAAEQLARQKYPDEFSLFSKEIKQLVDGMPDKSFMNTIEGWDNAIAYVRGAAGNIDRYVKHLQTKVPSAAQPPIEDVVGFTPTPLRGTPNGSPRSEAFELDSTTREIAREFVRAGVYSSEAEYARDFLSLNKR